MFKALNQFVNALVYSNIWIGLGAVSSSYFLSLLIGYGISRMFYVFIFATTMFTYSFQRLIKIKFAHLQPISGPRASWVQKYIFVVYTITTISFLVGLITGWPYLLESTWLIITMSFLSFFYVWKLPIINMSIRNIPVSKIFILGITWVIATGILPFTLFGNSDWSMPVLMSFTSSFLFIIAIAIPFDIRDMAVDNESLKTIPQLLGVRKAKYLAVFLLWLSTAILLSVSPNFSTPFTVNALFTTALIFKSTEDKGELFYSGWIDSTIILQGVFLYFW